MGLPTRAVLNDAICMIDNPRAELWTAVSGLLALAEHTAPYLQAPRVYKTEQWRCTCGYEMRFIPTRLCHCYALISHPSIRGLEQRLRPTPAGLANQVCLARQQRNVSVGVKKTQLPGAQQHCGQHVCIHLYTYAVKMHSILTAPAFRVLGLYTQTLSLAFCPPPAALVLYKLASYQVPRTHDTSHDSAYI